VPACISPDPERAMVLAVVVLIAIAYAPLA
jgi:hypothetical protein